MTAHDSLGVEMHKYDVKGTAFEVPAKYTLMEPVGQGAYGVVCSARDEETREPAAIKKIESPFEHLTFAKRTLRELRILRHLRHENLLSVKYVYVPSTLGTFDDIYVVSELMETDLTSIIKSSQPLSDDHCQFFLYQILRGLKYMHSTMIIHRDLKPRNLLVNSNCDLKICDYGLARVHYDNGCQGIDFMTEYVCTRWYRAPEVLCSWENYSKAIDIWSAGCIFAEMLRRQPLFRGTNTQEQLKLIIRCLGTPQQESVDRIPSANCRRFLESLPHTYGSDLCEAVPDATQDALALLKNMLQYDPVYRFTAEACIQQTYLSELHCPEDEPVGSPVDMADFEFERRKIDIETIRNEIFLECLRYHPNKLEQYNEEQLRTGNVRSIFNCRLLAPGESQYSDDEGMP